MAAASVSRTASKPMFLSMVLPLQRVEQPLRSAGRLSILSHADVHGVPEREEVVAPWRLRVAPGDPVHLVFEADLHPRVRLRELDGEQAFVARGLEVVHR